MPLIHTTVLSSGNAAAAQAAFDGLLKSDLILFVTLGDGTGPATVAQMADGLLGDPTDEMHGVWARAPADIAVQVAAIPTSPGISVDLTAPDIAFAIGRTRPATGTRTITGVITAGGPAPDFVDLQSCLDSALI